MIRAYYKNNIQQYKDFEDFLFLFPERHNIYFDFNNDTIYIDGELFTLSKIEFISTQTETFDSRYEQIIHKNQPNGYAGLDENGKVLTSLLPPIRITNVYAVQTISDRDVLTNIDEGDLCIVADEKKSYVWDGEQWLELLSQDGVISVDGRTGVVSLSDLYSPINHNHSKIIGDIHQTDVKSFDVSLGLMGVYTDQLTFIFRLNEPITFNTLLLDFAEEDEFIFEQISITSFFDHLYFYNVPYTRVQNPLGGYGDTLVFLPQNISLKENVSYTIKFYTNKKRSYQCMVLDDTSFSIRYIDDNGDYIVAPSNASPIIKFIISNQDFLGFENGKVVLKNSENSIIIDDVLQGLQDTTTDHENRISTNESNIQTLQEGLDDHENRISTNESNIYNNTTRIVANEDKIKLVYDTEVISPADGYRGLISFPKADTFVYELIISENLIDTSTQTFPFKLTIIKKGESWDYKVEPYSSTLMAKVEEFAIYDDGLEYKLVAVNMPLYEDKIYCKVLNSLGSYSYINGYFDDRWTHVRSFLIQ